MSIIDRFKKSDLLKGFASTTIWSGLSKLIMVLTTLYCTNVLTKDNFGLFSFIKNTLNLVVWVCATNFTSLCVKYAAEASVSKSALKRLYILFLFTFCVSLCCSIPILVIPGSMMEDYLESSMIVHYIKITGVLLPLFLIGPLFIAMLKGYKMFNLSGIYDTISSALGLIFIIVGIKLSGVDGAIIGLLLYYTFFSIAGLVIIIITNKRNHILGVVNNIWSERSIIITMILPVFLMSFIDAPLNWFAQSIVAKYDSYSSVGSLTVISQIRTFIILLPTYFFQAFMPFVAVSNRRKEYKEYFSKFERMGRVLALAGIVLFAIVAVFGKFLLSIFNEAYVEGIDAYYVGMFFLPIHLFVILYKVHMVIWEHQRMMLTMTIASSIFYLASLFILLNFKLSSVIAFFGAQLMQEIVILIFAYYSYRKDSYLVKSRI